MFKTASLATAIAVSTGLFTSAATAQEEGAGIPDLSSWRVASGLTLPVYVTAPAGDFDRLFIVEQRSASTGRVRLLNLTTNPPTLQAAAYLSVSPVATGSEQGLLGLAFHPNFLDNGYFWVHYNNSAGTTVVARYQANVPYATSTTAVAASATTVLTQSQPFSNHNGGWLAFGPDGHLYLALGDGGSGNDPQGNGQNINTLLGKILRIDVDGADGIPGNDDDDGVIGQTLAPYTSPADNPFAGAIPGRDEIWVYGVRNPWRNSFDRLTGDLYIGDVGQNAWEEISFQPFDSAGGENYGWRCMEANHCTGLSGCTCEVNCPGGPLVCPIHEYGHGSGCSITGGYVYRGEAIPELQGTYFYSDYCTAPIWTFKYTGTPFPAVSVRTAEVAPADGQSINSISSFGEDASGEMYIIDHGGEVFKLVPEPTNNICANAIAVTDGSHDFTTIGATTDGFSDTVNCNFSAYANVGKDVWYDYTATCTGPVTVSLCGANYNSKLAVYSGAACPASTQPAIACNDAACGDDAEVTFDAVQDQHYRIRVGGHQIATGNVASGSGTMVISCGAPKCPADINGTNTVDTDDLIMVINNWGAKGGKADIDGNNIVDTDDLLAVINAWGPC
jgi:glucose/arabinose dehydrogenase